MKKQLPANHVLPLILHSSTVKSDDKKRRILEATIELLAREGVECVTFEALGKKLGTTKANIRYHFNDKDDLIFTAVKWMVLTAQQITSELVESAPTPQQRLNGVILGAYQHLKVHPTHVRAFLMYFYYGAVLSNYNQLYKEARSTGKLRLSELLHVLPRQSAKKKNPPFLEIAEQLQNLITGQILGLVIGRGDWDQSLQQTQHMVQAVLQSEGIEWSI